MSTPQTEAKTQGARPGWLWQLVRRFEISLRWQFRRPVFFVMVPKAIAQDIGLALLLIVGGCLAPLLIVLTVPCRLGLWALSPFITPLVSRDGKAWERMAAIIASHNPPNSPR